MLMVGLYVRPANATITVEKFQTPDIKNDYCGAMIDFRFCKCGFHGDKNFCEQIGQTEATANETVQNGFSGYVAQRKAQFASSCGDENSILSGDTCTRCSGEHFRYKSECKTHQEMCGKDDLHLRFDVKTESCNCEPNFEKKESGLCEEVGPFDIKVDWLNDQKPPFLADGKTVGIANVSVRALKEKDQPFVPVKFVLTSGSLGVLTTEDTGDNHYRITFTPPDLLSADPTKNYQSGLNLNFTALNASAVKEEQNIVIPLQMVLYTPVKVMAYGFETKQDKVVFKGGLVNAEVNIMSEKDKEKFFSVVGSNIELTKEKIYTTDDKGKTKIPTPNEFLKGETDDLKFTLVLNEEVAKQLSQVRTKLTSLGVLGQNVTVNAFVDNFAENLAGAKSNKERKSLVYGLKRLNYALFFENKGQEFGKVSADSLVTVTKDAVGNMIDLLDSVIGITGAITDKINAKGLKLGDKAVAGISKQIDAVYKATLLKLGSAMQAGISYYAPDSKIYLGGLLKFLEDKYLIADKLKEKAGTKLDVSEGIQEYFYKQVNAVTVAQMKDIETFITEGQKNGFPTLENSDDLDSARSNYTNMAEKYIKAEQGEYWRAMTKSWFDLGFDLGGKATSIIFPEFATLIGQVENMYKVARTAFVDAANMFQWYKTHGDIMTQMSKGLKNSLGLKIDTQAQINKEQNTFQLISLAHADSAPDASQFMDAVADAQIYKSLAEIGSILAGEFPAEASVFDVEIKRLEDLSKNASQKAQELQSVAIETIPREDYSVWGITETAPVKEDAAVKAQSGGNKNKYIAFGGGIIVVLLAGFVYWKKKE